MEIGGRLRGVVTDATGAAIPEARVTLDNPLIGSSHTSISSPQGEYLFAGMPPATYRLTVEAQGFRRAVYESVTIQLNEIRTLNVLLEVGSAAEEVTVTSEAVSIVPQETTLRGLIDPARLSELPVNNRNWFNVVMAAPGIVRVSGATGRGGFATGGSRPTTNQAYIDGGDVNDVVVPGLRAGFLTSAIPIEAVHQFSVITANPTAEHGRSSGATLNVTTKGGTNQLHGSFWNFLRNNALDSRNFFDRPGEQPPLRQNEFGVRLGGPVVRDRAFFSGAYSGFRRRQKQSLVAIVPSEMFFENAAANPSHNPLLLAIMRAAYPAADPGTTDPSNPQRGSATRIVDRGGDQDSFFLRVDQRLDDRHTLFSTLNYIEGNASFLGAIRGTAGHSVLKNWFFVATHTWTLNPKLLNTFRFSWQRSVLDFPPEGQEPAALEAGRLRTAGPFAGQPFDAAAGSRNGFPAFNFQFTGLGFASLGWPPNIPQPRKVPLWLFQNTMSGISGGHHWRLGADWRRLQANGEVSDFVRPAILLNNAVTGAIFLQQQAFYRDESAFRRERSHEMAFFVQNTWRLRPRLSLEFGLRYELNLPTTEADGLHSNMYVLEGERPLPCDSLPYGPGMQNVAIIVPSEHGIRLHCTDRNNLAPRVGFAWDVFADGRTVIRGAYGIFYDRTFGALLAGLRFSPPFAVPSILTLPGLFSGAEDVPTVTSIASFSPTVVDPGLRTPYIQRWNLTFSRELFDRDTVLNLAYIGSRGLKLFQTERPNFGASFPDRFRPSQPGGIVPRSAEDIERNIIRPPFSAISNRTSRASSEYHGLQAELSRRMAHGLTVAVAYTWAHSLDTISDEDVSGADSSFPQATLHNLLAGLLVPDSTCAAAATTAASSTVTEGRLLAAVRCAAGDPTMTVAQAGQAFVSSFVAPAAARDKWGDSAFDVRHRAIFSFVYQLPFGQKQAFGRNLTGFLGKVASGWQVAQVFEAQTGTPLPIFAGVDANRDGDTQDRVIPTGEIRSAFGSGIGVDFSGSTPIVQQLACQTTGSGPALQCLTPFGRGEGIIDTARRLGRGSIRQQGIWNMNMMLAKRTTISERVAVQVRAEAFNLLNHVNFSAPVALTNSPGFGRILSQRDIGQLSRQVQLGMKLEF